VRMNPIPDNCEANYWLSCLLIDEGAMCEQIRSDLDARYKKEHGKTCPTEILEELTAINAEGRPIWKPMHMQPIYSGMEFVAGKEANVSADIFHRGLCLPSDNKMTVQEQEAIIQVIRDCFK